MTTTPVTPGTPPRKPTLKTSVLRLATAPVKPAGSKSQPISADSPSGQAHKPYLKMIGMKPGTPLPGPLAPPAPLRHLSVFPSIHTLGTWLAAGSDSLTRFAFTPEGVAGNISEADADYYKADATYLFSRATEIGACLGYSRPLIAGLGESTHSICYRSLIDGIAGTGGATSLDHLLSLP